MSESTQLSLLVISRDAGLVQRIGEAARSWRLELTVIEGYVSAFKRLAEQAYDFIIADCHDVEGPLGELFARLNYRCPTADVVGVVDPSLLGDANSPFDTGCSGLLAPDVETETIRRLLRQIFTGREATMRCGWSGKSPALRSAAELVLTAAPTEATVLLVGESGTGKELAARAIHHNSPRRDFPFMALNCAALAEGILESELFGHERGAFTNAFAQKQGVFEAAHGGTIFLDEIGDMAVPLQAKLLRVIEERQVRRVGGTVTLDINIRIIAATNHDLSAAVDHGGFRQDLYFRLSVIRLALPRLLDRRWDIPLLAATFATELASNKKISFADDGYELLLAYHWPGNVRELRNFVERLSILSPTERITAGIVRKFLSEQETGSRNLPVLTGHTPETVRHDLILAALGELKRDLNEIKQAVFAGQFPASQIDGREAVDITFDDKPSNLTHLEIETIRDALKKVDGNRRQAARLLGIGERTLYRKIKQYDL